MTLAFLHGMTCGVLISLVIVQIVLVTGVVHP